MIKYIKEFFRKRAQVKAFKKIEKTLLSNPKMMIEQQAKFEKSFGKDQSTRTRTQWNNLVRVYGLKIVCEKEGMTEAEVNLKCTETFDDRVKKMVRKYNGA